MPQFKKEPSISSPLMALCGLIGLIHWCAPASVVIYPAPTGATLSGDYVVKVGGQSVAAYRGEGGGTWATPYSFAYFDFSGSAAVEITSVTQSPSQVVIRPESKGIAPLVSGNVITFTLTSSPCHLSIEPDGRNKPLLLFANPPEQNPPTQGASGVVYYGPGLHKPGKINLGANQTLYIAGGAVVQGGVAASGANITIRGRGILDGFPWPRAAGPTSNLIGANSCTNLKIEGIIAKDGWLWNINVNKCSIVNFSNFKLIGTRCENNDGIDLVNTQHVAITDCFVRSEDDAITTKGNDLNSYSCDDITITRTSLWVDYANVWRLGCESWAKTMSNMLFRDIDVLHYAPNPTNANGMPIYGNPVFNLQPADECNMFNLRFENIRINHEGQLSLCEVWPRITEWAHTNYAGRVYDCAFKDIFVTGTLNGVYGRVLVSGYDAKHDVKNVTFDNFVRHVQLALKTSPEVVVLSAFATNILFTGPAPRVVTSPFLGAAVAAPRLEVFPNPFASSAGIMFSASEAQPVALSILDANGRLIRTLKSGLASVENRAIWDGKDSRGRTCESGRYLVKLDAGGKVLMQKALLSR